MDKIFEDEQVPLKNWLLLPNTQSTLFDVAQQQIYYLKDEEEDETFDQEWIDLRFIPWRFFYLDYHHLKQNIVESIGKGDDIEKSLESEWSKVNINMMKTGVLWENIKSSLMMIGIRLLLSKEKRNRKKNDLPLFSTTTATSK